MLVHRRLGDIALVVAEDISCAGRCGAELAIVFRDAELRAPGENLRRFRRDAGEAREARGGVRAPAAAVDERGRALECAVRAAHGCYGPDVRGEVEGGEFAAGAALAGSDAGADCGAGGWFEGLVFGDAGEALG